MVAPGLICGITTAVGGLVGDVGNTVTGVVGSLGLRSVALPPPVSDGHHVQRRELHNAHLKVKYARDEAAHAVARREHEALVKRIGSGSPTE